ncbi:glutamate 5-kinase [Nocardioides marmoriginsengisoli]|uniref:Glutamate 5-kinase n=1 Tax=Nocardioides marmoriginsengisoli TaxID=661483 RepID=A0A3N0CJZ1_9ACTN|nr:glutamate 5-kinase [Nocardioides marmoriginsengisoli]RNL63778.1 glutamate 5-kinase [Nocardioides marmoriginsengisoli]
MTRQAVLDARRIVVKVGSSSLTTAAGGIDPERVRALVNTLATAHGSGVEVVLVSSGAIAAGLAPLNLKRRPRDLARQQAAASVGQGILVHRYTEEFARHDQVTGQVLLTLDDVTRRGHHRNAQRTFATLLEMGVVPIVNENDTVATSEIRFGDNDRLAALVAHLVRADLLVLLSDVDGLYDGPPTAPGSSLVTDVRGDADLDRVTVGKAGAAGVGTGGMTTKLEAARIATGAGIPVVLTGAPQAAAALAGEQVGTFFHATGKRRSARMLWLAHATSGKGSIVVDAGAVKALTERKASLLPAGITGVTGSFVDGDPVDLVGPDGRVIARGLVNYDAAELPALMGRSTRALAAELGASYEREVVHRDDLTLLSGN